MIKSISLMTNMGKERFAIIVKWKDPANLLEWGSLATKVEGAMARFQTRMRLKPAGGFSLEELPQFLVADKDLGAFKVEVTDLNRGVGVEVEASSIVPSG